MCLVTPAAGNSGDSAQPNDGNTHCRNKPTNGERGKRWATGLQHMQTILAKSRRGDVTERCGNPILETFEPNLCQQQADVRSRNSPNRSGGKEACACRGADTCGDFSGAGFRDKFGSRGEGCHMPRFEHLHLTHHLVGKSRGRRKIGQAVEQHDNLSCAIELHLALNAQTDVSP